MNAIEQAIEALAEAARVIEKIKPKSFGNGTIVRCNEALSALSAIQSAEPVAYQSRFRQFMGGDDSWSGWSNCNEQTYSLYLKTPVRNGWEYEVRALVASPLLQAAQPITADIVDEMNAAVMNGELPAQCEEAVDWLERRRVAAQPNAELESMTRMFHAACTDLGLINEALDLDPDDGGAAPILEAIKELKSKAAQPEQAAPGVPEGWMVVPPELTTEMMHAWDTAPYHEDNDIEMRNAYRAMIAAAPAAPSVATERDAVDAKRYRWLTQHAYVIQCYTDKGSVWQVTNVEREVPIKASVNEAIDAAIAAIEKEKP